MVAVKRASRKCAARNDNETGIQKVITKLRRASCCERDFTGIAAGRKMFRTQAAISAGYSCLPTRQYTDALPMPLGF